MVVQVQAINKTTGHTDMPQFQPILRDMQATQNITGQLQYFRVGHGGVTTKQLNAELRMLAIATTPRRLITEYRPGILETERQGMMLIMIEVETTDRSGILWTQAEISMMQCKAIEILP